MTLRIIGCEIVHPRGKVLLLDTTSLAPVHVVLLNYLVVKSGNPGGFLRQGSLLGSFETPSPVDCYDSFGLIWPWLWPTVWG